MYQIYADNAIIYDSTSEEYKIAKGTGTLEVKKSGSFTFALYSGHPFYDMIIKNRTVIKVKKSGRILFRGRVISSNETMKKQKTFVCEGERGFFQDSIVRPYSFSGTPAELFSRLVTGHNQQVDDFKQFKIGDVTVYDPNNYILRENSGYESTLSNLDSRLPETTLGGYIHITHEEDGTEDIPTVHYLADFQKISNQNIEFGYNLKDFLKKVDAAPVATAIIPLGARLDSSREERLTIKSVKGGIDYIYNQAAVDAYGWIFKTVIFDDVTEAANLLAKGKNALAESIKENITVELKAVDMHLLDRSIDSFCCGEYVRCISTPHNFAETLLCTKYSFDMLKPQNDAVVLGGTIAAFTGYIVKANANAENAKSVAYTAFGTAGTAAADAADAKASASAAQSSASSAAADAASAKNNASAAQSSANSAASDAASAKNNASAAAASAASSAADAAAAKKEVKEISEKTAAYRIAEQQMTSLLAKSFGVFKTEELQLDGSTIHYMHDKPTLAASKNIWKMTGDAFAVSSDGGNTWSSGMDASGNAILNVLSVIGVEASWINADNLSAISANLGGWQIKDNAIFKEIIDANDRNLVFRIHIRAPKETFVFGAANLGIIEFEKSTDGGKTFLQTARISGQGGLKLQSEAGLMEMLPGSSHIGLQSYGRTNWSWNGIEIRDESEAVLGYIQRQRVGLGGFEKVVTCYVGKIYGDSIWSNEGYSGNISLGNVVFEFRGGILVNAYLV